MSNLVRSSVLIMDKHIFMYGQVLKISLGGVLTTISFSGNNYFIEGRTNLTREANGPEGSNCSSNGVRSKTTSTYGFPRKVVGGCGSPLPPSGSVFAYAKNTKSQKLSKILNSSL